jgi:6-phosphofructokinase 2
LDATAVPRHTLPVRGRTRISVTVHERSSNREYRFVPEGPELAEDEWTSVLAWLEDAAADWIVASGSLPRGVPEDFYARVAELATRRGQHFVLDASGLALRATLGHGVALVKPSLGEFEALLGCELNDSAALDAEAMALVRSGAAERIAVTLGRDGALLATRTGVLRLPGLEVPVRSTVGAGDSFLAAMTLGLARGDGEREALVWAIAAGAAAVARYGTAHVRRADVEELRQRILATVG